MHQALLQELYINLLNTPILIDKDTKVNIKYLDQCHIVSDGAA